MSRRPRPLGLRVGRAVGGILLLVLAAAAPAAADDGAVSPRGHVEYVRVDDVPLASYALAPGAVGLRAAVLSRDPVGGAETTLVVASPLWRWERPVALGADFEVLMIDGELTIAGRTLVAGDFLWVAAGTPLQRVESPRGARFVWMPAGALVATAVRPEAPPAVFRRVPTMPWTPLPGFRGRTASETVGGLAMKLLRQDAVTGAYTVVVRHAPGYADPRLEAHDTWEELLLLEGDYLMGSTGVITAGAYIFRPGTLPHGPQATRTGAVWFARGEKGIDFQLTLPEWAPRRVQEFVESGQPAAVPERVLGEWSR